MKKLLTIVLIFALALTCVFAGGAQEQKAQEQKAQEQKAQEQKAQEQKAKSQGSVYWLNFKPEPEATLLEVAALYKAKTGVPVKVVTAASGTYNETLTAEMDKSTAPTLFIVGNQAAVDTWADYCYDLNGTKIANELNTDAYNLYAADGKLVSIGYCYECFGIIVNKELLKKAGYDISDIKDFASLKKIAEDIHARSLSLGFDAFTSSGMDGSSSWRFSGHLANAALYYESRDDGNWTEAPATIKGTYLPNFKNLWDLYIDNSGYDPIALATGGFDAEAEFGKKEAVFYQNGNWEYDALVNTYGLDPKNLQMIPLYCGVAGEEKAGLNAGTENCWAVNAKASQADIDATIDFMYWMVTDADATKLLAEAFGAIPYKKAAAPENVFLAQANEYANKGCYTMSWAFNFTPNVDSWRAGVVSAMNQYDATRTAEAWKLVETAFVQGWAQQYKAANN